MPPARCWTTTSQTSTAGPSTWRCPEPFVTKLWWWRRRKNVVDTLMAAIQRDPTRHDLRMKLLETLYTAAATNLRAFKEVVRDLARHPERIKGGRLGADHADGPADRRRTTPCLPSCPRTRKSPTAPDQTGSFPTSCTAQNVAAATSIGASAAAAGRSPEIGLKALYSNGFGTQFHRRGISLRRKRDLYPNPRATALPAVRAPRIL